MTDATEVPTILSAVDDIFFSSKIESVARLAGVRVVQALDAKQLAERLADTTPRMVIFDLNSKACAPLEAIRRVKADARLSQMPLVGFFSHVQHDLEVEARKAGCDQVMPRSYFSSNLARILESIK